MAVDQTARTSINHPARAHLRIEAGGSHVPHKSLRWAHARLHAGHRSGSQQAPPELHPGPTTGVRFRWHPYAFDTSSAVHFRSSSQRSPDGFIPPFPESLTTLAIGPAQHPVVWTPVLQPESEGPSLISHAARLLSGGLLQGLLSAPSWRTVVRVPN